MSNTGCNESCTAHILDFTPGAQLRIMSHCNDFRGFACFRVQKVSKQQSRWSKVTPRQNKCIYSTTLAWYWTVCNNMLALLRNNQVNWEVQMKATIYWLLICLFHQALQQTCTVVCLGTSNTQNERASDEVFHINSFVLYLKQINSQADICTKPIIIQAMCRSSKTATNRTRQQTDRIEDKTHWPEAIKLGYQLQRSN